MFLTITYDIRWGGSKELNDRLIKSISHICDGLQDLEWQQSANNLFRNIFANQIVLSIVVRLLNFENIETNNIKSYYRYNKQKNCLNIDMVFCLEDYIHFSEKEIVKKVAMNIYDYLVFILTKYSNRLIDFNTSIFQTVLEVRLKEIGEEMHDNK